MQSSTPNSVLRSVRLLRDLAVDRILGRPLLLSHLVTCRCPCRCETCLWRGLSDARDELTADEITAVYRDAARCGVRVCAIWGGEPLVRDDLPEILRASREAGLLTTLITSGWRLVERFDQVIPWVDGVIFSLDAIGPRHDAMRGQDGLFDGVCSLIRRLRGEAPDKRAYINTAVSCLNADGVPDLARLARELGVPIWFNPIETGMLGRTDRVGSKINLALGEHDLSSLARRLIVLKGRGYPIANSYTYLRGFIGGKQRYRCQARKACLELRANGDVMDCLDRFHPVTNVRETSLARLLARPEIRRLRLKEVSCQFCNNANVIDTSHAWSLRPESIWSLVQRQVMPVRPQGSHS
jgi:MoaA/NifB/PqqE/SkfB family radical SAM enzyme